MLTREGFYSRLPIIQVGIIVIKRNPHERRRSDVRRQVEFHVHVRVRNDARHANVYWILASCAKRNLLLLRSGRTGCSNAGVTRTIPLKADAEKCGFLRRWGRSSPLFLKIERPSLIPYLYEESTDEISGNTDDQG